MRAIIAEESSWKYRWWPKLCRDWMARAHAFVEIAHVTLPFVHLTQIDIALRIRGRGDAVQVKERAGLMAAVSPDRVDDLQCLAVENAQPHIGAVHGIEKHLLFVGRKREAVNAALRIERVALDEGFLHERSVELEHLQPVIGAVGYIDQAVVGNGDAVHWRIEKRGRRTGDDLVARGIFQVHRLSSVGSPMTLVGTGVRIKNDNPAIGVAVGHEKLVRFRIDEHCGGLAEIFGVIAAFALSAVADLQQEFTLGGEFQNLRVVITVAADPHVIFVIDKNAVLVFRPLVTFAGPSPGLHQVSLHVEFKDGRRGKAAFRRGRMQRSAFLLVANGLRTMNHPDVIVRIDGNAGNLSGDPFVRQRLGPSEVQFKFRNTFGRWLRVRGLFERFEHQDAEQSQKHRAHNADFFAGHAALLCFGEKSAPLYTDSMGG
jgi:hypothetical protein